MSTRFHGTVATWNESRGFGFIAPDDGGSNVFVHVRALPRGSGIPAVGEALSYEIEHTPEGKTRARFVILEKAAEVAALPPRYGRAGASILSFLPIIIFATIYFIVQLVWRPPIWVLEVYIGTSLLCFLIYLLDKQAASGGRWRVSESALLLLGLAGGWPGAIVAQQVLRHKTKKRSFQAAFAGSVVVNVLIFVILTSPAAGHLADKLIQGTN